MKALYKVAAGPGSLALREAPRPMPDPGQVVIRVKAAGICGSDLHIRAWDTRVTMRPPVIVGHDVAFDMRFFEIKEKSAGVRFSNPVLDTLLLESIVTPNQEDRTLEAISRRLGVTASGRHTALGDSLITAEIFLAMIPLLSESGIHTLTDARKACRGSRFAKRRY